MIRFHLLGTVFSLHPLTLIAPILAVKLGMRLQFTHIVLALGVHELAHVLAAKCTGVSIREIRILPFGGSARMENPYGLRPLQLISVAIAGPLANMLAAVILSAAAQWRWISVDAAASHSAIHLTLCFFNLLPALPLDGGRILYGLLQRPFGSAKAIKLGIFCGKLLSAALASVAFAGFAMHGRLNLTFILAAVFILCSALDERDAYLRSCVRCRSEDCREVMPLMLYQVPAEAAISDALRLMRPKYAYGFVIHKKGKPPTLIPGYTLTEFIYSGGASDTRLGELSNLQFSLFSRSECGRSLQVHPR